MLPTKTLFALVALVTTFFGGVPALADTVLIPKKATWKYLDNGSNQGTVWKESGFSDAVWASGPGELGYGDGSEGRPEATVVSYGSDPNNRYITTYFRHSFAVVDPAAYGSLILRVMRDDGVVVYLNGQEVWRDKMPTGTIGYRTLATVALGGADEYNYAEVIIPVTQLRAGQNVIAAEIHQANATSTDISFDLELTGRLPGLVRQPYLQLGTPTSMTIRWRSDLATDSVVRFGSKPDALTGEVRRDETTPTPEHEVKLTNLTPDTRYYYSVGSSAATYASGEACVFFTAPPVGSAQPTRVWAIGDAGTGTANQAAVRDAYYNAAIGSYTDVMLMLGDNAYDNGTDSEYTLRHFNVYQDVLRRTVTWPTIGNHDTASSTNPSSSIAYYRSFTLPTGGEAGGIPSGTEDYYSFEYGDIHFICLDSMTESRSPTSPMVTWLKQDLANTIQKWLVAFWHHPPYSKGHDSDTETALVEMRTNIVPILEEYGVDLVLCGHSHAYERSWLMNGHYGSSSTFNPTTMRLDSTNGGGVGGYNKPTFDGAGGEGAVYAVAGSSGKAENYAGIVDNGTGNGTGHPAMYLSWERLGSLLIDVDGHRMDVKFFRENGVVADSFTITRGPRVNAAPEVTLTAPGNGSEYNVGVALAISATASDTDQGLQQLVLYANESRIATLPMSGASGSVSYSWTPPGVGNYRLQARAVDQLGNSGISAGVDVVVSHGAPAPDTTSPGAVVNLTGSAGISDVALTWRAPGDDGADNGTAASYDIRYSLADPYQTGADFESWWTAATPVANPPLPQAAGTTQGYTITGLSSQQSYFLALKATDDAGNVSAISNIAAVTTLTAPPAAPTNLVATNDSGKVALTWNDNSSDEDGFSIERSLDGTSGFAQIQWVGADVTSFLDELVYAGSTYFYRVLATNGNISSIATNVAKVTVPPGAPENLVGPATSFQVKLTWNTVAGAQSYGVSRLNPASGSYDVLINGLTAATYTDGGLASGTSYTYRVAATNLGGTGPFAEVTVQTSTPNPPAAPSGLIANATGTSTIELAWTDNSQNESGFYVERATGTGAFSVIATLSGDTNVFSNTGLVSGATYSYRVQAFNADGASAYSGVASATTLTVPVAPSGLTATAVSKTQINLAWTDNSNNEHEFWIERSTDNRTFAQIETTAPNVSTYSSAGLAANKFYYYRVRASNTAGTSAYSNVASAKTPKK